MGLLAALKRRVLCGKTTVQENRTWTCAKLKGHDAGSAASPHQSRWTLFPSGQKTREKQYTWSA